MVEACRQPVLSEVGYVDRHHHGAASGAHPCGHSTSRTGHDGRKIVDRQIGSAHAITGTCSRHGKTSARDIDEGGDQAALESSPHVA